jgi:hypothetical protein
MFSLKGSLQGEMERMDKLRTQNPDRSGRIMKNGTTLVGLAGEGDLEQIKTVCSTLKAGDLFHWFNVKMFKAACTANQLHVIQYMVENGMDLNAKFLAEAMHFLITGYTDAGGDANTRPLATSLQFMISEGCDVNFQVILFLPALAELYSSV